MAEDIVKQALAAAANFKARGIKKAALDVVSAYEHKCPDCGQGLDLDHAGCKGVEHDDKNGGWRVKKAAPGDPNQPQQPAPAAPQEPVQRDQPAAQPQTPAVEPPAPAAPEAEVEEPEEAEETPEEKIARWRDELDGELSDDSLIQAVIEFLQAEDFDLSDVKVSDGYVHGTANIELGRSKSYVVCISEEEADSIAINQVKQDMQNEPELFNKDFLEGYIDTERLRDALMSDVEEMVRESPDSYGWDKDEYYETEDFENYTDSEGNPVADPDEVPEEWVEQQAQSQLADPMRYLEDIYGDDTFKRAIEIAGIDEDRAAADAVAADGWQHFLARYDGNSYDLPSGGVYWRD